MTALAAVLAAGASPRAAAATVEQRERAAAEQGAERAEGRCTKLGAGEGALNMIAWAGYAEDGSTDPKVDWVTPFEKKTGCKVKVKTATPPTRWSR